MIFSSVYNKPTNGQSIRLAVVVHSLDGGGIQRMRVNLIREWIKHGIEVDLVTGRARGQLYDLIPEEVKVFEVAGRSPYLFPFGLWRYLKNRQPTHILSSANDINVFTLLFSKMKQNKKKVVVSFHDHLSSELENKKKIKRIKLQIATWLLSRLIIYSDGVIAVSQGVANDIKKYLLLRDKKIQVIYNPVITSDTIQKIHEPLIDFPVPVGYPWLLYVGKLIGPKKGLDVLVKAFKKISDKTDAHLVLIGEGPMKKEIEGWIKEMGLIGRVHMVGYQQNPLPWMREADVFILPSRHEGLPNVIIEAMACGTQIVATDCPSGPAEILEDGKYGQLVPVENVEALSRALLKSLNGEFRVPTQELENRAALFTSARAADKYTAVLNGKEQ